MGSRERASSVPASTNINPFWSQRVQADQQLEEMRPGVLAEQRPVPDDDWEESPRPLLNNPSGSGGDGANFDLRFETPPSLNQPNRTPTVTAVEQTEPAEPTVHSPELVADRPAAVAEEPEENGVEQVPRPDRCWLRRAQRRDDSQLDPQSNSRGGNGSSGRLEEALGKEVVRHFQKEATRLQAQNDMLTRELRRMQEHQARQVPVTWQEPPREPKTLQRPSPPMSTMEASWVSFETFRTTPNGTRVPAGSPPPDPPPLPAWPFDAYLPADQPRKFRGVMGDRVYRVASDEHTPRTARNLWLEREVERLNEVLEEIGKNAKPLPSYFTTPFLTHSERDRETAASVNRMMNNVHAHQDQGDSRAGNFEHELGGQGLCGRAGTFEHSLGGQDHGDRASSGAHVHGEVCHPSREALSMWDLGAHPLQVRAELQRDGGARDDRAEQRRESGVRDSRAWRGGEGERDGHGGQRRRGRSASRGDHEVEDGDLKSIPITLPSLPAPEGRDSSLEAGDWLIQLEPLVGDLSKNASSWWRQVMTITFHSATKNGSMRIH